MNRNQNGRDQRDYIRFKRSHAPRWEKIDYPTDGSFTHSNFKFDDEFFGREREERRSDKLGRFPGPNRFGEERVHHDRYQDDQFRDNYDPTYEDEYGMRHPYEHGDDEANDWSHDLRSEASGENHIGKGPKGYRRSDLRIKEEASEILLQDHELDASGIEIEVQDRVLILRGEVHSRRDKRLAEDLLHHVSGIDDVQNQLYIKKNVEGWIPGLDNVDKKML